MAPRQNPTDQQNLSQWSLYKAGPRERRMNVVSDSVTIYGEAPSGAHVAEPRWVIWKETKDESGRIHVVYAQEGINTLRWIYNTIAFDPVPDLTGKPYAIQLDNNIVYDGMVAGLPVANITVFDVDDITHDITIEYDPYAKFSVVGNVLTLADSVQLVDIAYPLTLKATDDDGNEYSQIFAIYVEEVPPGTPENFTGELNIYEEDDAILSTDTVDLVDYTVPADRRLRLRDIECFGTNRGEFEIIKDGDVIGKKATYYTRYETNFDYENYIIDSGENIKVRVTNCGTDSAHFNVRLRGYQYAF